MFTDSHRMEPPPHVLHLHFLSAPIPCREPHQYAKLGTYTLDDCKKHTSDKDCWLVVHGANKTDVWDRFSALTAREGLLGPRGVATERTAEHLLLLPQRRQGL